MDCTSSMLLSRMANGEWRFWSSSIRYSPFAIRPLSSSQIHFHHALVLRNLIDRALGQHRAFVQTGYLDAEVAHEGHVVLDHDDGMFLGDLLEQFRGLPRFRVGHAGDRF